METGLLGNLGSEGWGSPRSPEEMGRARRRNQSHTPPHSCREDAKKIKNIKIKNDIKSLENAISEEIVV